MSKLMVLRCVATVGICATALVCALPVAGHAQSAQPETATTTTTTTTPTTTPNAVEGTDPSKLGRQSRHHKKPNVQSVKGQIDQYVKQSGYQQQINQATGGQYQQYINGQGGGVPGANH